MRSLPRLLFAAVALGVAEQPSAFGQDQDPRTGLPNQTGVSVIANGTAAPNAQAGTYGATVLPTQAPDGGVVPLAEALGPGGGVPMTRFMPRVSVSYLAGNQLGLRDGFTSFEAWIPLQVGENHQMMFADMHGLSDNFSHIGANIGLGYRSYNRETDRVSGVYGYFDYKDSGVARYNQVSFGFESLGRNLDYRANVYIPVGDEVTTVSDTFDCLAPRLFQSFILLTRRLERESAMRGVDGEFGFPILDSLRLRAFFGAYYFDGREVEQAYGARPRIESQATENLHLQASIQSDTKFGTDVWGGFTLTFPGPSRRYGDPDMLNRLNDAVMRNYNVVVARKVRITEEVATSTVTGQPINVIFVDDDAAPGGDGTTENPFNTFAEAEAGSNPGDIIFVRSGTYVGQSITLQIDQRFLGDGIPAPVAGDPCLAGGFIIAAGQCPDGFLLPGSRNPADRPNILNAPGDAITLSSRNEVGSFNIIGSGGSAIAGVGGQSFNLHDMTIAQSGGPGINLVNYFGSGSIRNVITTQNGGHGVSITSTQGTLTVDIRCLTSTLNLGNGVNLATNTGDINATIFNSDLNNNFGNGLSAVATGGGSINVDIQSSSFNANTVHGAVLNAADGTVNATIDNSTFDGNTGLGTSAGLLLLAGDSTAIPVTSGNSDILITNSSFNNNEGAGIQGRIDGGATAFNFTMIGSVADNNGFSGVEFNVQNGTNNLNLIGNVLSNNSRNGFAYVGFGDSNTTAAFLNNFIIFNGGDPFAPGNLRDGVRLQVFTTSANALSATFTNNTIVNNGGPTVAGPRGHGVFINAFSIGAATTGADITFNGDNISANQESGIRALLGGGAGTPLNVALSVDNGAVIDFNGLDGVTIDNNQFSVLTATFDDSFIRNNAVNGILINNVALAAGEQPSLATRIQGNVIDDNGTGVLLSAGVGIVTAGRNANPNLININNNVSISRNNVGIFVTSSSRTATSITNHRNILNDDPRLDENVTAGIILQSALTGGPVPQDRTEVHDVRISNNAIDGPSEAIVLNVAGGSANPALGGGRMDAIVTQNILTGTGFVPTTGLLIFGPPPALFANRGIENARFLAVSGGVRSFMRLRLEQNNVNDLQYNLVLTAPVVTAPGNTDGNLFDVASSAGTNQGFSNPALAAEVFGPNTGVYGFADGGTGILDSLIAPPPSTAFGADFNAVGNNITINIVQPNAIAPAPFPPPP